MSHLYVAVLAVIVAVLLSVAIYRTTRVKTKADYLVAGRSLPAFVLVLTLLTSWIGAGSLFAGAENAYRNGFAALWQPAGGWLGLLLIYFIAPRARKFAQFTLPDLLEARYNQTARVLGTFAILFAYVGITSYQFKGGGNVLHLIFPRHSYAGARHLHHRRLRHRDHGAGRHVVRGLYGCGHRLPGDRHLHHCRALSSLSRPADGLACMPRCPPSRTFRSSGELSTPCVRALEFLVPTMLLMLGNQVMYQKFFSAKSGEGRAHLRGRLDSGHTRSRDADRRHRGLWLGALSDRRGARPALRNHSLHRAPRTARRSGCAAARRGLRQGHLDGFELSCSRRPPI